tara:strand:- start:1504 stop:1692 length:189 start_codon:yes stop_codon:yes gene_type:complete
MIGPIKITDSEYFYKGWTVFRESKIWSITPQDHLHPRYAADNIKEAFNLIDEWEARDSLGMI